MGFPGASVHKEPTCQCRRHRRPGFPPWASFPPVILLQEDPLEEEMATRSSTLAWRILWTEEPGGLQSVGSQSDTAEHTQTEQRSQGLGEGEQGLGLPLGVMKKPGPKHW